MITTKPNHRNGIPVMAAGIAVTLLLLMVTPVSAATLQWGPYLTGTTTTGTVVNVRTDTPTSVTVEYAADTYYAAHAGYEWSATDSTMTDLHHIPIAGLDPGTRYHYRVVADGELTADFHFTTFPESGRFTFVVYSDTQDQLPTYSQLERHKLVADRIALEQDVAFVLNSGDLVNDPSTIADWDRYFAAGAMMMANTTVFPALGNHDAGHATYYAAYGVPAYYSFDCADSHITVLNSNSWAWDELPVQSAWLANDLQTEKPFRFISFHHPLYTSEVKHFGGWENLRQEWESTFNENGVLAVFNGHVHAYERFLVNDTNYFVAGIGGGPAYNLATPRAAGSKSSIEYMLGYTRVTVDPSTGTATAEVIRVADVARDLRSLTTVYPPGTVFETVVMTIHAPPVAAFSAEPIRGNAPLTVRFADASTGPVTSYAWDFDNDGSVDSTEKSAVWKYTMAGSYSVRLVVHGPEASDDELRTDYIRVTGGGVVPAPEFPAAVFPLFLMGAVGLITALTARSRSKSG